MKTVLFYLACALVGAAMFVGCWKSIQTAEASSPVRVVDQWAYHVAHDDFGKACELMHIDSRKKQTVAACAANLSFYVVAYSAGAPDVIPHSQQIRGDKATVGVLLETGERVQTNLTKTKSGWRIDGWTA